MRQGGTISAQTISNLHSRRQRAPPGVRASVRLTRRGLTWGALDDGSSTGDDLIILGNIVQCRWEVRVVKLRFLGKSTTGGQSPTLYATDRDSYVVQGWTVSDPGILDTLTLADDETIVEIYARLLTYLAEDGLGGEITNVVPPIVQVRDNGNYILQGLRLTDAAALGEMDIPEHETCVEVPKRGMALLSG